jgi:hypothetical protein
MERLYGTGHFPLVCVWFEGLHYIMWHESIDGVWVTYLEHLHSGYEIQ